VIQDADDRPRPKVLGGFRLAANLQPPIRNASMYARTIYDAGKVRCESCGVTVEFPDDCTAPMVAAPSPCRMLRCRGVHRPRSFASSPRRGVNVQRASSDSELAVGLEVPSPGDITSGFATSALHVARLLGQVAQDRRLAEDRRGAQPAHGGGSMTLMSAANSAVLILSLLAAPFAAEAQAGKVYRLGYLFGGTRIVPH
jgi:hypothetical protein